MMRDNAPLITMLSNLLVFFQRWSIDQNKYSIGTFYNIESFDESFDDVTIQVTNINCPVLEISQNITKFIN